MVKNMGSTSTKNITVKLDNSEPLLEIKKKKLRKNDHSYISLIYLSLIYI